MKKVIFCLLSLLLSSCQYGIDFELQNDTNNKIDSLIISNGFNSLKLYNIKIKETQMDFHNNSQGRQIAYGSGRLYQLVHQALDNGKLRYLSHLEFTTGFWRATNSSQLIPTNQ